MGELSKTLAEIKEDKGNFYLILDRFKPVIKKYTNLLYKDENRNVLDYSKIFGKRGSKLVVLTLSYPAS